MVFVMAMDQPVGNKECTFVGDEHIAQVQPSCCTLDIQQGN